MAELGDALEVNHFDQGALTIPRILVLLLSDIFVAPGELSELTTRRRNYVKLVSSRYGSTAEDLLAADHDD